MGEGAMNTQIRFTTVEVRENRLHMQALKQQAEQDALAESQPGAPPLQMQIVLSTSPCYLRSERRAAAGASVRRATSRFLDSSF